MVPSRSFPRLFHKRHGEPIGIAPREPAPLDPTRPSVAQLPDLIVRHMLTFVQAARPNDMLVIASLSSSLYQQVRYTQHRHVHVDLDKPRHVLDRLQLIKRLGHLATICTLQVSGSGYDDGQKESNDILDYLAVMLPAMTGLCHVHWLVATHKGPFHARSEGTAVPIPAPILVALPAKSRLHTSVFCNAEPESHQQARIFLHRVEGNHRLNTLSIVISFIKELECVETMRFLKRVLLSCPNLTRIPKMDVWYRRGPCDDYGPPLGQEAPYPGLGFSGGERPPALEELGMQYYPWGLEGRSHLRGYPNKGYEWDYWADTFDWSRLVRLNDAPEFLLSAIAPKLTRLRELVLDGDFGADLDVLSTQVHQHLRPSLR